jgi:hypothetical protein
LTPPVAGADLRAALVASCFLGALPPVDLRAVCLVRAIVYLLRSEIILNEKDYELLNLYLSSIMDPNSSYIFLHQNFLPLIHQYVQYCDKIFLVEQSVHICAQSLYSDNAPNFFFFFLSNFFWCKKFFLA